MAVPWLRRLAAGLPPRRPGSIPGQSIWDLWWTKWHWHRFFPEYFGFPLSVSFHRCSITRKRTKNNNHHRRHLHHRVAQEASRLRCVRNVCCGALHHLKIRYLTLTYRTYTQSDVCINFLFWPLIYVSEVFSSSLV
jgi:hypothetical protein